MSPSRGVLRVMVYAWTAPTTLVGVLAGAITLSTGGRVQYRRGTLEFYGGFARWLSQTFGFGAMTLGHAIIGRDSLCLDACRDHEQAHVRQAERWGPAFLPAYIASSVWEWGRGRHFYLDNYFERDARRACGEEW